MNSFKILEIEPTNDFELIKSQYKKLILRYHPDKNTTNTTDEQFIHIQKAFDLLKSEKNRKTIISSIRDKDKISLYQLVSISDMEIKQNTLQYPCRCGCYYELESDNIENLLFPVYLSCPGCSFYLCIQEDNE